MGNTRKLLTLEQLSKFCEDNSFLAFSSKNSGYTLSVQVPGNLTFEEKEDNSLLYTKVKVCHTLLNRNKSYISEENMKKAMGTLKYKPLLASIVETDDGLDFNGHDMEFVEDENGNQKVKYIEKQVGTFTNDDPYLEYDAEMDKTYVMATAVIPRDYTETAAIIERKGGTKVSCELQISEMQFNIEEKCLELTDFIFTGVTCLGESIGEGMLGSRLDIADFSTENNSVKFEQNEKLIEVMTKLTEALNNNIEAFNAENTSRKEDYAVADVENMENAEVVTEEIVEDAIVDDEIIVTESTDEEVTEVVVESTDEADVAPEEVEAVEENTEVAEEESPADEFSVKFSVVRGEETKEFSVSLSDKLYAMNCLINETYGELDNDFYDVNVYEEDGLVEMYGYFTGKAYRQSFKCKKEKYSLVGDRIPVFAKYLSEDEIKALEQLKVDYAALEETYAEKAEKLAKYEAEPNKMEILNAKKYGYIAGTDEFNELVNNHFDLSVEEVTAKANEILLSYAESGALKFSAEETHKDVTVRPVSYVNNTPKKTGRYGDLFSK